MGPAIISATNLTPETITAFLSRSSKIPLSATTPAAAQNLSSPETSNSPSVDAAAATTTTTTEKEVASHPIYATKSTQTDLNPLNTPSESLLFERTYSSLNLTSSLAARACSPVQQQQHQRRRRQQSKDESVPDLTLNPLFSDEPALCERQTSTPVTEELDSTPLSPSILASSIKKTPDMYLLENAELSGAAAAASTAGGPWRVWDTPTMTPSRRSRVERRKLRRSTPYVKSNGARPMKTNASPSKVTSKLQGPSTSKCIVVETISDSDDDIFMNLGEVSHDVEQANSKNRDLRNISFIRTCVSSSNSSSNSPSQYAQRWEDDPNFKRILADDYPQNLEKENKVSRRLF
ncbi:uncharacterized protein DDB_G0290587-like [Procambarus clarkii]|uniref:uncharacterized protein DDB_G0290587-like n=1 Tax=Procambarus clarkii TaxID=6728 RepID=UPI0037445433